MGRVWKRLAAGAAALLLAGLCIPAALAGGDTFYIAQARADIPLPPRENYYCFYPDMPDDEQDLAELGMTADEVREVLNSNGILFSALHRDISHEISVQLIEGDASADYRALREAERDEMLTVMRAELEQEGYTVCGMDWLDGGNGVWPVTELLLPGGNWLYQVHTCLGEKTLAFTASSAVGTALTDGIRRTTENMALETVFHDGQGTVSSGTKSVLIDVGAGAAMLAVLAILLVKKRRRAQ